MKTQRVKNSIYNSLSNLICNLSVTILSFIVRTVFIRKLGEQCLGLDGLFTNILTFLSLADLGFSTAVSFSLYEPLANKDNHKISKLMVYFKNVYRKIAAIILIFGICLIPFLNLFAKDYTITYNIYVIYSLYLLNTVSSYLTSYNNTLLEADQKNYKITGIKLIFNFIVYGLQLAVLLIYNNFVIYLLIQFIFRQIERLITYQYIKNLYKNVDLKETEKLSKEEKNKIQTIIKGLLFHKVGHYAVNGTDNILISSIINISTTGIYGNYFSIVSIFRNLIGSFVIGTTSSFGNLNVLGSDLDKENSFDLVNFLCYSFAGYIFLGIFFCINPLINIWIGEKFVISSIYVFIICVNFYLEVILLSVDAVKTSAGIYHIDRYVPIIEAIINLVISIVLGYKIGLAGILLGTCISSITTISIINPYIIYRDIFHSNVVNYFKKIIKNILLMFVSFIIIYLLLNHINITNNLIKFICYGIITSLVYGFLFILFYFKSKEFKYYKNLILKKEGR